MYAQVTYTFFSVNIVLLWIKRICSFSRLSIDGYRSIHRSISAGARGLITNSCVTRSSACRLCERYAEIKLMQCTRFVCKSSRELKCVERHESRASANEKASVSAARDSNGRITNQRREKAGPRAQHHDCVYNDRITLKRPSGINQCR